MRSIQWLIAIMIVAATAGITVAQSLLPNGSFEHGGTTLSGWQPFAGGTWEKDKAHHGERSLHGVSRSGGVVWVSESIPLRSQHDYRLEGWILCSKGEARLNFELLGESDRTTRRISTPPTRGSSWRYMAVELSSDTFTTGRVSFWVKGEADLDDVNLTLVETSYIGNKGIEGDERGRVPFWNEEKSDTLLPGRRAGTSKPDAEIKREGKTSVQLTPTGDWFGIASVNYPVAAWTDRLELSGWARCSSSATTQILACWTDDSQNILRVDASSPVQGNDWQRVAVTTESIPPKAMGVRIVAVARGGPVWFDEFELLRLRPREPRLQIFVNQIGYDRTGTKSVVMASNFFPTNADTLTFELVPVGQAFQPAGAGDFPVARPNSGLESPRNPQPRKAALRQFALCAGRIHSGTPDDWGWYFWRVDFSQFQKPGRYRAVANVGSVAAESVPFSIGRHLLLTETAQNAVDFFHIQRCGFDVAGWHKACHLDDATLPDGTHIDVTGGWHSAGDYNKLMYEHGDGGVVFALLTAYDSAPNLFARFDRNSDGLADALDEARWGAAFVAKMQISETGALRNHVNQGPGRNWTKWSAPEVHTDNKPGTEDDPVIQAGEGNSPLVIGGWARLAGSQKVPTKTGPTQSRVSQSNYLQDAVRLWLYATKGGTNIGSPYLLISTIELHRATKEPAYLDYSRRAADHLLSEQTTRGPLRGAFGNFGDTTAAALAQFALAYPKDQRGKKIQQALGAYTDFCVASSDNAFGLSPQTVGATNTFFPADLGNNFQVLSRAWAAALVYQVTHDRRALRFAQDHVDWLLGKNPINLCMFEGKGAVNPPRYHHRYNMIPGRERGAVPGTVPNGFVRDMGLADRPGFDLSRVGGRAPSYRTSEPWLVHNLFFLLATSALDRAANN